MIKSSLRPLAAIALNLMVIWLLCAELAPGINESHYLTKAKAAWDAGFAPGDLFLSSGNAHWLFSQIAGWMSTWLPLTGVAWVGRLVSWLVMAVAWQRLSARLHFQPMVAACVLAGWLMATRYGNWAGEWAVGGFEGKSLAYPCVMLAITEMLVSKWTRVWPWCGLAVAFHPLVGGWAGLTLALAWFWDWRKSGAPFSELTGQLLPLALAGLLGLVGIVPALAMIGGPARYGEIVVAQIHAFYRLSHHQSPHLFWMSQHISGGCSLGLFLLTTLGLRSVSTRSADQDSLRPIWKLTRLAWWAVVLSGIGLVIDLVLIRVRPDLAAGLLRFYWFRWSDIIVPLAWVSSLWSVGLHWQRRSAAGSLAGTTLITACALATVGVSWSRLADLMNTHVAPADKTLLMSDSSLHASGPEVVTDWLSVCSWARQNTPADSLFLTPRAQQTFKWYAARAEVVTFKDVPQDSQSLIEWYSRIGSCAPPRDKQMQPLGWSTKQIMRLHDRYHFDYLLVDRRIQREPPLLEMVYPNRQHENKTYAIFRLPQPGTH